LQAQLAVGEFLGVTLSTVRAMSMEEYSLWLEWMRLKSKQGSMGKAERRKLR